MRMVLLLNGAMMSAAGRRRCDPAAARAVSLVTRAPAAPDRGEKRARAALPKKRATNRLEDASILQQHSTD
jgi:hypothetical protein